MDNPNAIISVGTIIAPNIETGTYSFPTEMGADGTFLGIVDGELAFRAGGVAGISGVQTDSTTFLDVTIDVDNVATINVVANPALETLEVQTMVITSPDGNTAYELPPVENGVEPTNGYVIAYAGNGLCEFVPASGGGGSVDEVTGSTNITISGTQTNPQVDLNADLVGMGNIEAESMTLADQSGTTTLTTTSNLNIANVTPADGVVVTLLYNSLPSITLDGVNGLVGVSEFETNSAIPPSDYIKSFNVVAQDVYVCSSNPSGGNAPSYNLPLITGTTPVGENLLAVTTTNDVNGNNSMEFVAIADMMTTIGDITFSSDSDNKGDTLINATGTRSAGKYLQATGSNPSELAWVTISEAGTLVEGTNIVITDMGGNSFEIATVGDPTFTGNVNIANGSDLICEGTIECADIVINAVNFVPPIAGDDGKFLKYDNGSDSMIWADGADGVQSIIGTTNQISVDNTDPANPILSLPNEIICPSLTTKVFAISSDNSNYGMTFPVIPNTNNIPSGYGIVSNGSGSSNFAQLVQSVTGTANQIEINDTDPSNPVIGFASDLVAGNLSCLQYTIKSTPDNTHPVTLPELTDGAYPQNGFVIASNGDGTCSFIENAADGVQSVSGTANQIVITGTAEDPVVELAPALDVETSVSAPALIIKSSPNNTHPVTLPELTDGAYPQNGFVLASNGNGTCSFIENAADGVQSVSGTANQIVITGTAEDPVVELATEVILGNISINSANDKIETNTNPANAGILGGDHVKTSTLVANDLFITTKLTTGEVYPSYKLPEITDDIPIGNNLILKSTTADINNSNALAFETIGSMIAPDQDIACTLTGGNIAQLNINALNRGADKILQVNGTNTGLEWIDIPQGDVVVADFESTDNSVVFETATNPPAIINIRVNFYNLGIPLTAMIPNDASSGSTIPLEFFYTAVTNQVTCKIVTKSTTPIVTSASSNIAYFSLDISDLLDTYPFSDTDANFNNDLYIGELPISETDGGTVDAFTKWYIKNSTKQLICTYYLPTGSISGWNANFPHTKTYYFNVKTGSSSGAGLTFSSNLTFSYISSNLTPP